MEEPTVLPEDWELLSSLPLALQPLVDEIAVCLDPVFHEGARMCGVYTQVRACVCVAHHDWLYVCVCVCETKGVERISSTLVSFPPRALCCLWWLPCRESGEGGRTLPLHLSFHLGLTSSRLFLLHSLHTRHLPPSLSLFLSFFLVSLLSRYLQFSEDRMVLYAREEDPHGVRPVVQVRDAGPVQVAGQLVDVRLQLSEGWKRGRTKEMRDRLEGILARHASVKVKTAL